MLIFAATFLGLFSLYMLLQTVRPLVERTVITSDDWQRIDDHSSTLIGRRDRLLDELRDLEFEASLNKIVGRDLDALRERYEGEALAVMALIEADAKHFEGRIGRDIDSVIASAEARRRQRGQSAPNMKAAKATDQNEDRPVPKPEIDVSTAAQMCTSCQTTNRPQARFCDVCGAPLGATE